MSDNQCKKQCGTRECQMWGCQAHVAPPQPDTTYLYSEGDIVRHRTLGEIIGVVVKRIDRDYTDEKGNLHKHSFQCRGDEKIPGLGSYPSYLLRGLITGTEFEWTQRDKRLFAEYEKTIAMQYKEWTQKNDK